MENRCWVLRWVSQSDSVPSQGVLLTLLSQLDLGSHCGGVSCTHTSCAFTAPLLVQRPPRSGDMNVALTRAFLPEIPLKGEGPSPLWPLPVLVHYCTRGAQVVSPSMVWPGTTSAKTHRLSVEET